MEVIRWLDVMNYLIKTRSLSPLKLLLKPWFYYVTSSSDSKLTCPQTKISVTVLEKKVKLLKDYTFTV